MTFYNSRTSTRSDNSKSFRRIEMSPERRSPVKSDGRYLDREYGFSSSAQWTRSPVRDNGNSFGGSSRHNSDRHPARRSRDRDNERPTYTRDYARRGSPRGRREDNYYNGRSNNHHSHRSRSPRRRGSEDIDDDLPYYRSFASRYARQSEQQNKPVMRLFDPANVPRGRNYFEHDSRDDVEGGALDNSYSSQRMYDPRNDFDLHRSKDRNERRSDGWSYHNAGAGADNERKTQGKFIPRNQFKYSENEFFSRKRPLDLDEPWVHDKFEELVKEERSPRRSKHEPEDECLSEDDGNDHNFKKEDEEEYDDEEQELAIKRRLTANLRKREARSRSRSLE